MINRLKPITSIHISRSRNIRFSFVFFSEILPNKHKHTQSWDTFINDTKFTLVTKFTFKMDIYNRKPKFKSWCCMIIIMKINQNVYVYMNFTMSWSLWIGLWSNFVSTMTNIEITIPFSCSFFSVFWLQLIMLFISIIQIMMIIIDQSNQYFFFWYQTRFLMMIA